jgi:putative two-component system response regulator
LKHQDVLPVPVPPKTETITELPLAQLWVQGPRWESVLEDATQAPTILIVDGSDVSRRLLRATLKTEDYRILEATRPSAAFAILDLEHVDLVIVDMMLPEMTGPEFCQALKSDRRTQLIPILMTTGLQGTESEVTGLESGADDFLTKPMKPALVRVRVRTMLRHKALVDSLDEAETILFALAQSVEHRDKYTGLHCERLATYSIVLAQALGLSKTDQLALFRGGYLHDIGKIAIPDAVLFKRGKLSPEEWKVMRQHTLRGEDICKPMKSLAPVLPIIRSHHERWDGSGYPDGLRGGDIPLLARVLQIADIYDALTTSRPYKPAYSHEHAVEIMRQESARGWRDPELVPIFARISEHWAHEDPAGWQDHTSMQQALESMRRQLSN